VEKNKIVRATAAEGLPGGTVCSLARDGEGRLWFAKGGWIGMFRNGRFDRLLQLGNYTDTIRLACGRDGGVWICFGRELFRYNDGSELTKHGSYPAIAGTEPNVALEDRTGAVWI